MTAEDIVDLTEQMRDLGVSKFSVGDVAVEFRSDTVVAREAERGGKSPGEHVPAGRDLRSTAKAQGIGPPSFPGSDA